MKIFMVILTAFSFYLTWKVCVQSEKLERYKSKLTDLKAQNVELTNRLEEEKAVNAKLLEGQIFTEQRPYRNWFYPVLGENPDEEND